MRKLLSLSLILSSTTLLPAAEPEEVVVLGALDAVTESAELNTGLDVMEFLTSAYSGHGYYETGGWDDDDASLPINPNLSLPSWTNRLFMRPVEGKVTSYFGYRPKFGRVHKGVDIVLCKGDTVRAALPGTVEKVGYDKGGYGHYVIIRHDNNVETRYGHLQKPLVKAGQEVTAGETVALGGSSGNSTAPHLHFETRYMGTPVNPIALLRQPARK